jgi:hypothetical protein
VVVFDYADERQRECRELSLDGSDIRAAEEAGGGGQRGRLLGAAYMSEIAYIAVHELVVVEGEHVHRLEYAYYLVVDDEEIGGYERDPRHDPAEHRHCSHAHGGHRPGGESAATTGRS